MTGGTDNGAASLALDSTGCSSGGVLKWNGTSWACGSDNNSSYSVGTGLDLNGTTFSVNSSYQLPQNCGSGQVPKSSGSGSCQNDENNSTDAFPGSANAFVELPNDASLIELTHVQVPAGNYVVMAKMSPRTRSLLIAARRGRAPKRR